MKFPMIKYGEILYILIVAQRTRFGLESYFLTATVYCYFKNLI